MGVKEILEDGDLRVRMAPGYIHGKIDMFISLDHAKTGGKKLTKEQAVIKLLDKALAHIKLN